jgi:hypothetical protein
MTAQSSIPDKNENTISKSSKSGQPESPLKSARMKKANANRRYFYQCLQISLIHLFPKRKQSCEDEIQEMPPFAQFDAAYLT